MKQYDCSLLKDKFMYIKSVLSKIKFNKLINFDLTVNQLEQI